MQEDETLISYKGVNYYYEKEYEEDNVKIFHLFSTKDKSWGSFPYSPYRHVPVSTFKNWVDMGMPTRDQLGGHFEENHVEYYNKWLDNQIDKMLVEEDGDAI